MMKISISTLNLLADEGDQQAKNVLDEYSIYKERTPNIGVDFYTCQYKNKKLGEVYFFLSW